MKKILSFVAQLSVLITVIFFAVFFAHFFAQKHLLMSRELEPLWEGFSDIVIYDHREARTIQLNFAGHDKEAYREALNYGGRLYAIVKRRNAILEKHGYCNLFGWYATFGSDHVLRPANYSFYLYVGK